MGKEAEQVADRVKTFILQIRKDYPVVTAWLFGSWAAGNQHEHSDIDIGVVVPDSVTNDQRFAIYSRARDFDINFEVVVISEHDYISEDPVIVHEMKTKGIRVA